MSTPDDTLELREHLIDRIASGDRTAAAWSGFTRHAGDEAAAWRAMAESLRDQLLLVDAAAAAAEVADRVELPPSPAAAPRSHRRNRTGPPAEPAPHRPAGRTRAAAGWLVALLLLVSMIAGEPLGLQRAATSPTTTATTAPPATAGFVPSALSAADALSLYLDRGRDEGIVLEDQPDLVLLESRPVSSGGGYELLYVRRILERAVVPEMFLPAGVDDDGRPVITRIVRRDPGAS